MPRLEELQTPCLLVHLDKVRHNLDRMRRMLGGSMERWRPHVKTTKIPEVLRLLLAAGVRRFKCATSREADVLLAQSGEALDLLVAMAHQGPNLKRFAELAVVNTAHRFSMLSEDPAHTRALRQAGLGVFVDIDPGYGRSGIGIDERERIASVVDAAGDGLRGLHYYDGHLHHVAPDERVERCRAIYDRLVAFASDLPGPFEIVTSGTPTFPMALDHEPFRRFDHTVSPGTVVYWDTNSSELGIEGFDYAVNVQARVISHPRAGQVTLDAGSKALDAAAGDPCAIALGDWRLRALTPSEEHLPMRVESGRRPPLGTLLRLVPAHVCPTVNLADHAVLLEDERVVDIVPVAARGHEI